MDIILISKVQHKMLFIGQKHVKMLQFLHIIGSLLTGLSVSLVVSSTSELGVEISPSMYI